MNGLLFVLPPFWLLYMKGKQEVEFFKQVLVKEILKIKDLLHFANN